MLICLNFEFYAIMYTSLNFFRNKLTFIYLDYKNYFSLALWCFNWILTCKMVFFILFIWFRDLSNSTKIQSIFYFIVKLIYIYMFKIYELFDRWLIIRNVDAIFKSFFIILSYNQRYLKLRSIHRNQFFLKL